MQEKCRFPGRCVLGHPFTPTHLMRLVEVVGGERTDPKAVDAAIRTYAHWGRVPVRLNREIYGHIGNRLATALWREAVHLLAEGVATAAEIDRAVVEGPGRKWALTGPFESYALSGGDGGIRRFLEPFSPGIQRRWDDLGTPQLDAETRALIATSVESALTGTSGRQRQRERARRLVALSRLLDSGDRES